MTHGEPMLAPGTVGTVKVQEELRVSKDLASRAGVGDGIKGRSKDSSKVSSAPGRENLAIPAMDTSANVMGGVGQFGTH